MYPYAPYLVLKVLQEERIGQAGGVRQHILLAQQLPSAARLLALALGHAFVALGTCLERFGQ